MDRRKPPLYAPTTDRFEFEPGRRFHDASLDLEGHLYGRAPIQCDGQLRGHPYYFRARHSGWSFTLCLNADVDPSVLREGHAPGFFDDREYRGYALWGDYGTEFEASYMAYDAAEEIVRQCAARFLADDASSAVPLPP